MDDTKGRPGAGNASFRRDAAAVLAVILVPAAFYVAGLGFYSDDWAFYSQLATSADQSLGGLYARLATGAQLAVRPPQILLYLIYYKVAPGSFLFPHLVNLAMLCGAGLVLLSALREVPPLRRTALAITVAYLCIPHFVAMKLWYANHMSTLSLLAFALAFRLVAKAAARQRAGLVLLAGLVLCSLISVLAYELLSFILLGLPLFVALSARPRLAALLRDRTMLATSAALVAGFVLAALFKLEVGSEMVRRPHGWEWLTWSSHLYRNAAYVDFWRLGAGLPLAAWRLATGPWFAPAALLAALVVPAVLLARRSLPPGAEPGDASPLFLILAGLAAFVAGYLPFLVSFAYAPAAYGIGTRDNVGAGLGIALILVAACRSLERLRPLAGRAALAGFCALGVFVQTVQGINWTEAWNRQQAIYARLGEAVPDLAEGDVLLLYGLCPYHGSAQVYSSSWGLGDRLRMDRRRRVLDADTITHRASFDASGVTMREYSFVWTMPYGRLKIWDVRGNSVHSIRNHAEAQAFFAAHPIAASTGCHYVEGEGEPLF